MKSSAKLKELIKSKQLVMTPGAYDAITAFLIQEAGFPAVYITGSGVSLSLLGHPDLNTISYLELKQRVENIRSVLNIPLIVDIDTGFGGPLNLIRLVKDFQQLDVAAVQIEDQAAPKRCGHELGRKLVTEEEMCRRIKTIVENRAQEDGLLIIARTDARTTEGIETAIKRANVYLESGADVIFVESPETMEEIERISREVKGPTFFNNVEGGRSPFLKREELERLGFSIVIYPNALTRIIVKSAQTLLRELREKGTTEGLFEQMLTHRELFRLFGHDNWVELESKYFL